MADGDVKIRLTADAKGAIQNVKQLEKTVQNLSRAVKYTMKASSPKALEADIKGATQRLNKAKAELEKTVADKAALKSEQKSNDKMYKEYFAAEKRLEKLKNAKGGKRKNATEIEETENELSRLNAKLDESDKKIGDLMKSLSGSDVDKAKAQISQYSAELKTLEGTMNNVNTANAVITNSIKRLASSGLSYIGKTFGQSLNTAVGVMGKLGQSIMHVNVAAMKMFGGAVIKGLKGFISLAERGIGRITRAYKKLSAPLSRGFKMFTTRRIRSAIMGLISGISQGLGKIAQISSGVNKAMTSITASGAYVKNSFAAMVTPAVDVAARAFYTLSNAIVEAMNAINRFLAMLGAKSTYIRAKRYATDYAETMKKAGSAAEDSLMSFDEINRLQGGGGGGDTSGTADQLFEEVDIEKEWLAAFEASDFYQFGVDFANKLADSIDKIDWSALKEKSKKISASIVTWINGAVSVPELATSLGTAIGNALNLAVGFKNDVFYGIDWTSIGERLGESINSAVDTIDETELARSVWAKLTAAVNLMEGLFGTLDIDKLTVSVKDFAITTFDLGKELAERVVPSIIKYWNKNATTIANDIGRAVATSINAISSLVISNSNDEDNTTIGGALHELISGCISTVNWDDLASAAGTLLGQALKSIADLITFTDDEKTTVAHGIATLVESCFESLSVNAEGIMEGIVKGIETLIQTVETLRENGELAQSISDLIKVAIKYAPIIAADLADLAMEIFNAIKDALIDYFSDEQNKKEFWESIKTLLVELFTGDLGEIVLTVSALKITANIVSFAAKQAVGSILGGLFGNLFKSGYNGVKSLFGFGNSSTSAPNDVTTPTNNTTNGSNSNVGKAGAGAAGGASAAGASAITAGELMGAVGTGLAGSALIGAAAYAVEEYGDDVLKKWYIKEKQDLSTYGDNRLVSRNFDINFIKNLYKGLGWNNGSVNDDALADELKSKSSNGTPSVEGTYVYNAKTGEWREVKPQTEQPTQSEKKSTNKAEIEALTNAIMDAYDNLNPMISMAQGYGVGSNQMNALTSTYSVLNSAKAALLEQDYDTAIVKLKEYETEYNNLMELITGETVYSGGNDNPAVKAIEKIGEKWNGLKALFNNGGKISITTESGIGSFFGRAFSRLSEGLGSGVNNAINKVNSVFDKIRSFSFLGLTPFSGLPSVSTISIPKLAEGAVIPANNEFLAVLGDQKSGTNIEAPLDTIVQAVMTAMNASGMNANAIGAAVKSGLSGLSLKVDRATLGAVTADAINANRAAAGKIALNL